MFRIVAERLVWWPVTFPGVSEDGEIVEHRFELRLRLVGEDQWTAYMRRGQATDPDADADARTQAREPDDFSDIAAESARVRDFLLEMVADWRGVAGENGEPLPFNPENFMHLLQVPNASPAIGQALIACRAARAELREGN